MTGAGARGAYGFRLEGLGDRGRLLVPASPDWVPLEIVRRVVARPPSAGRSLDARRAEFPLLGGGRVIVERSPSRAVFETPERLSADELAHPYLVPAAAVHAHWLGRAVFHAGAFVAEGAAWGVAGGRRAGKSSLLAGLARRGLPVLSDDLLVVEERTAFAGPRAVDLRRSAALHLGTGRDLGVVGGRGRWRVPLGPAPPQTALVGWVFPAWGDRIGVRRVPPSERLPMIAGTLMLRNVPADPVHLLGLAALPAFQLRRPRSWEGLEAGIDALLRALSGGA